jgi:Na+/H+-dicarboxylate symporter
MIRKIALHWQILIALVFAVAYGIVFPTEYQLSEKGIETLHKKGIQTDITAQLEPLVGKVYTTQREYSLSVKQLIGEKAFSSHQGHFIRAAYHNPAVNYVSWLGDLFLRALKMIIIPLILSSLISGITSIGSGANLGRLGLKTFAYYISTSLFAIMTGLFLVNLFKPGIGADLNFSEMVIGLEEKQKSFREILIEIIPTNIFEAFTSSDMLSIIFFAIIFGFFITRSGKENKRILQRAFNAIFEVMMLITNFIIKFTPLGIFGIVAKVIADQDDLSGLASRMGLYMLTVILALAIHFLITLPMLSRYIGKIRPFRHMQNMSTPLLTAFSTCSSGATLPLTIDAVENKSGVSNKISSFTLPLGATINMDGTALYECVAAIFIAQAYGYDLSLFSQFIIVVTALLASIGAAAIPMAGLVMITVILSAVGLPLEGIGLILAVDRILDMFRTATNVWSDSCGAVIIAKSEGESLNV